VIGRGSRKPKFNYRSKNRAQKIMKEVSRRMFSGKRFYVTGEGSDGRESFLPFGFRGKLTEFSEKLERIAVKFKLQLEQNHQ
jgi:hypothetical protein